MTEDEHYRRIQQGGEAYLHRSLAPHVSGEERGRVIFAALKYLSAKARRVPSETMSSQSAILSQAVPQQARTSSFLSTLAASLDFDIPVQTLISVTVEAGNLKLIPVLTKCLSILAKTSSVGNVNSNEISQTSQARKRSASFADPSKNANRKSKKVKKDGLYDDVSLRGNTDTEENEVEDKEEDVDMNDASYFQKRTGQAFVDDFVTQLVQLDPASNAKNGNDDVFLASIAREAPLTTLASKTVLVNLLHRIRSVKLDELPAFVYQTLLFASAKGGMSLKKLYLLSLTQQFKKIEETVKRSDQATQSLVDEDEDAITSNLPTVKEVCQVQGTTLFHIDYALKQDPALASELVKFGKSNIETQAQFMTPFGIAILMAVARSPSVQTEVLAHIRDSLAKFEKERSMRENNLFAARVTLKDEELMWPSKSLVDAAVRTSGDGWEFIAEPFFNFANLLLDRPVSGEKTLGIDLLRVLFCAQPSMRKPIMEQIVSRIALKEKSAADAISVLSMLARRVPLDVLELNYFIRQSIEDCVRLAPSLAASLIEALKPLLRSRRDLLDYFYLVMRKALFHRESSNRAVAAHGFISILALRTHSNGTQTENRGIERKSLRGSASKSRSRSSKSELTEADITRIKTASQPLRRVMTHPPALKALFYKEVSIFLSCLDANPEREALCLSLNGLLRPHFLRYIDAAIAPYILIDICVDESAGGVLLEPLGDLIQCLAIIQSAIAKDMSQESYIVELARKVASVSLTDFSISKDNVSTGCNDNELEPDPQKLAEEAAAKANRVRARVLGNVAEALISATLAASTTSSDPRLFIDIVFPLLTLRAKVFDVLKHLGCASLSDAVRDLGGDATIESSYSFSMGLKRPGRSSTNTKKPSKNGKGSGKGPGKVGGDGSNNIGSATEYRFGAFNVLYSAAHVPTMPLMTAMHCLEKMVLSVNETDPLVQYFEDKREDSNISALHSYLLAVALKHIQNANEQSRKSLLTDSEKSMISSTICPMSRIAIQDFQRIRAAADSDGLSDQLIALQIVEAYSKSLVSIFDNDDTIFSNFCAALILEIEEDSGNEHISPELPALKFLEKLVEDILRDDSFKECALLLGTYLNCTNCIDRSAESVESKSSIRTRQAKWARKLLNKYQSTDATIVRILTSMALLYSENNDDLRVSEEIIDRIHVVVGDCDATADAPQPTCAERESTLALAESIRRSTSLAAVDSVLDTLDKALTDVEWCLSRMLSLESTATTASENADHDSRAAPLPFLYEERTRAKKSAQQANRAEDAAQTRLEGIIRNLQALSCCAVAKWTLQERILRIVTRAYKQLSIATQAQIKRKADPRTSFLSMIETCKALGPSLWMYLAFLGTEAGQDASKKRGNVSKEARIMPQLIYEVEHFENLLISAQKHTRVNLLKGMRRNTARDFRIQEDLLKTGDCPSNEDD